MSPLLDTLWIVFNCLDYIFLNFEKLKQKIQEFEENVCRAQILKAEAEARLEAEKKERLAAEEKARLDAEAKAQLEAEKKARLAAEEKERLEAEESRSAQRPSVEALSMTDGISRGNTPQAGS